MLRFAVLVIHSLKQYAAGLGFSALPVPRHYQTEDLRILVVTGAPFVKNSNLNTSNLKEYETAIIKGLSSFIELVRLSSYYGSVTTCAPHSSSSLTMTVNAR